MLARYLTRLAHPLRPAFSTTRDQLNYYNVLELESGATADAIRKAYAELTEGLRPGQDPRFKILNEAFVILSDNKTRDAYDSLLSVKKSYYLSEEQPTPPATRSALAHRQADRLEQLKKKLNIDEFGRYKGGLPNRTGTLRGKSRGEPGVMHTQEEIEESLDQFPEFNNVTAEKAESFKNFHSDEREARQIKWPWFSFQVDYDFFALRTFRKKYWPVLQLVVFLTYILPVLYYTLEKQEKAALTAALKAKAQAKQAKPPAEHA